MSSDSIHLLTELDAEELLTFELENRAFFSSTLTDRGDDYYSLEQMRSLLADIVSEQLLGRRYMYVIRNEAGELVGRVNLFDVVRGDMLKAELGYRVGQRHNGKGYATAAVKLVLADAFGPYGLHRVEAATSPQNIGSQVVLIKNGFQFTGRSPQFIRMNGVWQDSVHFAVVNPHER